MKASKLFCSKRLKTHPVVMVIPWFSNFPQNCWGKCPGLGTAQDKVKPWLSGTITFFKAHHSGWQPLPTTYKTGFICNDARQLKQHLAPAQYSTGPRFALSTIAKT
jgi:hypothetical protein